MSGSKQSYVGKRVGRLTVTEATKERKNGYIVWSCHCDCGKDILLDTRALQRGHIRDCGCAAKEKARQRDADRKRKGDGNERQGQAKNLLGEKFGRLTVIAYAGKINGVHKWLCRCDCGKQSIVRQDFLTSGKTQGCGCAGQEKRLKSMGFVEGTSIAILQRTKKRLIASNKSGCAGVYQNKKHGKWCAQITFKGKTYFLGAYEKKEDAIKARRDGEKIYEQFIDRWQDAASQKAKNGIKNI